MGPRRGDVIRIPPSPPFFGIEVPPWVPAGGCYSNPTLSAEDIAQPLLGDVCLLG
ncbi:hypothetical protein ANT_31710 [Anaerolinea thermophila UNI-1]|uniref:Uncharacterized protein n=1 Tax=Anaerolinea thermophila (strain DSM 14523 / JCM 11388 / NBRC 100420 / UNI-1) TaxID=926569 RepID=E8N345_ANATU|nr:hypothetical protein ANT_31710 [Anaerolinea thermophila UNI-1]